MAPTGCGTPQAVLFIRSLSVLLPAPTGWNGLVWEIVRSSQILSLSITTGIPMLFSWEDCSRCGSATFLVMVQSTMQNPRMVLIGPRRFLPCSLEQAKRKSRKSCFFRYYNWVSGGMGLPQVRRTDEVRQCVTPSPCVVYPNRTFASGECWDCR